MTNETADIVVIDDNKISVSVYTNALIQNGLNARGFTCPDKGLDFALSTDIKAAVIDLVMEPIDGFEVLSQLKAKDQNIICIAMSASASEADKENAKKAGFDLLLVKPFKQRDLFEFLSTNIKKRSNLLAKKTGYGISEEQMSEQLEKAKALLNQACFEMDTTMVMDACHQLRECAVLIKFPSIKASLEDIQKGVTEKRLSTMELTNVNQFIQTHLC